MTDIDAASEPNTTTAQALTAIRNDYRWSPACQRAFLEELACSGSVTVACKHVAKSPRSAYDLRFRRDGAALALGWDAAILVARVVVSCTLMDRALHGYDEVSVKQEDGSRIRHKIDNKLGQNLLARLDKMAEGQAMRNSAQAHVQMIFHDFEAYLDLIGRGGTGAQAALFCAARRVDDDHIAMDEEYAIGCELERISAESEHAVDRIPDMIDEDPEVAAQRLSIWYDDHEHNWKTNFPPPVGESAAENGGDLEETAFFGEADYERLLTSAEQAAHIAAMTAKMQPWIDAGAAARDAWFGGKLAA